MPCATLLHTVQAEAEAEAGLPSGPVLLARWWVVPEGTGLLALGAWVPALQTHT